MGNNRRTTQRRMGEGSTSTPCNELSFETALNSPDARLLASLRIGEMLSIARDASNILLVQKDGQAVGSITSTHAARLLACLAAGHLFSAQVVSIDGGKCLVAVLPA